MSIFVPVSYFVQADGRSLYSITGIANALVPRVWPPPSGDLHPRASLPTVPRAGRRARRRVAACAVPAREPQLREQSY